MLPTSLLLRFFIFFFFMHKRKINKKEFPLHHTLSFIIPFCDSFEQQGCEIFKAVEVEKLSLLLFVQFHASFLKFIEFVYAFRSR